MLDSGAVFESYVVPTLELAKSKGHLLAAAAALGLLLRYKLTKKPSQLIKDLGSVGKREGEEDSSEYEFDVIIAGGGTAGCVLASRLSEDPSIKVLLLECGGSGVANLHTKIPAAYGRIMGTEFCWNYYTEPQTALTGTTSKYWPQGRMLGGSSSMNAMMFHYGCPEDYDEWARENPEEGSDLWSYKNFSKYFLRFEKYVASKKFPGVDVSLRGSDGPIEVGYFGYFSQIAADFISSCVEVGIPRVHDFNTAVGTIGVSKMMTYINSKGRRVSAESAYLTPKVLSRPNLKVAIHAHVTRILFDESAGTPKAVGIEFTKSKDGLRFAAKARKEVVVSAGAMHTPQVLMLSGVGPAEQLISHGIPVVADLPGVGSHLQDHIVVDVRYRDKSGQSLFLKPTDFFGKLGLIRHTLQWLLFGTGPMTENVGEAAAFVRSTDPELFPADDASPPYEDSTSGPGAPDLELFVSPLAYANHGLGKIPYGHLWSLHATLLRPTSHGTIRLKSADPFQGPAIDPKYLTTEHDLNVLVRGLKLILRIAHTRPLHQSMDTAETDSFLDQNMHKVDDVALAEVVKSRVETLYHPCSTARMAPLKEGGVVDPYLRVHGIENLRVVDASVFPTIVAGHTTGVVLAIAEQAADLIKAAVGSKAVKI